MVEKLVVRFFRGHDFLGVRFFRGGKIRGRFFRDLGFFAVRNITPRLKI